MFLHKFSKSGGRCAENLIVQCLNVALHMCVFFKTNFQLCPSESRLKGSHLRGPLSAIERRSQCESINVSIAIIYAHICTVLGILQLKQRTNAQRFSTSSPEPPPPSFDHFRVAKLPACDFGPAWNPLTSAANSSRYSACFTKPAFPRPAQRPGLPRFTYISGWPGI